MTEKLERHDATGVKAGTYKLLYTVPTGYTFVISCINTTSANTIKLKIDGKEIGQNRPDWALLEFFKWLILQEDEQVSVTHAFSWAQETIMMSWSLISN